MATAPPIPGMTQTPPVLTEEQQKTIVPEKEQWDDTRAAAIAIGDFRKAEQYRQQNHDLRYQTADQLYLGWVTRKTWEGTKIARSSLAIHLVLQQVEAMLPSVVSSLFPDEGDLPFTCDPDQGTSIEEARAVRDLLSAQIRDLGDRNFMGAREIVRRHVKSRLVFGNGITEFGWTKKTITREMYQRQQVPLRQAMPHPITGESVMVPTGQVKTYTTKQVVEIPISKACLQATDIRDFYWDPNCSSHNMQDASYCCVRGYMTINALRELRGQEGFNIPDDASLLQLARHKTMVQADNTKRQTEVFRGMAWAPYVDQSLDPNLARVEVIRYWQRNRHVWIVRNYAYPLYNQANCYGVLPFLTSPYIDVVGRWAGMSLPDLCETDQRLIETILNARVDELSLLIHPPIIKKRGIALPLSQQRVRPGLVWESDDPSNDYKKLEMGNVTAQAFVEVDAAERRVQQKTGITDLAVLGTPSAGGNSANRTATGIQSQGAASGKRIQYQVENDEDWLIVPMLSAIWAMDQKFLMPEDIPALIGQQEAQLIQVDPVQILNASVKFTITASGRMRQKAALQSGGLSVILETIANPALLDKMEQRGLTINETELVDLVTDTLNIPRRSLYRMMSPQEQQASQQAKMGPDMIRMQMQRERNQAAAENQDSGDETKLLIALLTKILTPQAAHQLLNETAGTKLDTRTGKEAKPSNGKSD